MLWITCQVEKKIGEAFSLTSFIVGLNNHSSLQLCHSILLLSHLFTFHYQEVPPRWIYKSVIKSGTSFTLDEGVNKCSTNSGHFQTLWQKKPYVLLFAMCSFREITKYEEWVLTACIPFVTIYWKMNVTGGHNITFHDKVKTWQHYNAVTMKVRYGWQLLRLKLAFLPFKQVQWSPGKD